MLRFIDVALPLFFAILLITSPQAFTKMSLTSEEGVRLKSKFRRLGYLLFLVAAVFLAIKFV